MKNTLPRFGLITLAFSALVFIIQSVTLIITGLLFMALYHFGFIAVHNIWTPLIVMALFSLILGTIISLFFSKRPLRPINAIIDGLNKLAKGDYEARIDLGKLHGAKELTNSFNTLATELQNTEMLRSDFVNNFSHEFKTPIVSISGFANLLQKVDLPDEQRREYLQIIAEEANRLADMATSVMNLTKIENQSILTDVKTYNLSEQLRTCILLLEKRWSAKQLVFEADFAEQQITANEELLKQMWINLIDNAIKFADPGGTVKVRIEQQDSRCAVSICNTGPRIPEEEQKRIFQKFYQSDDSHSGEGIGLGLSIVKKIANLHSANIAVDSNDQSTTFTVKF